MNVGAALDLLARGERLSRDGAQEVMGQLLRGELTSAQMGALLVALRVRGEEVDEIVGFAQALRASATPLPRPPGRLLDTCGTGGDGAHTLNVSTAAALIAAAAGARVAKHGNRAVSSRSGSADVLEACGVRIDAAPEEAPRFLDEAGFVFLFAPRYHPAMRHVAGVRRELGIRTVMNLLGPLVNPAACDRQLVGVFDDRWLRPVAEILAALGVTRALVVRSHDGLDELSPGAPSRAILLEGSTCRELELVPGDAGIPHHDAADLRGGTAAENAARLDAMLGGERGAYRDAALLNAGAALWVWGDAPDLREGVERARDAVGSGRAATVLATLRRLSLEARP